MSRIVPTDLCGELLELWDPEGVTVLADWCEETDGYRIFAPLLREVEAGPHAFPTKRAWKALNALAVCLDLDAPAFNAATIGAPTFRQYDVRSAYPEGQRRSSYRDIINQERAASAFYGQRIEEHREALADQRALGWPVPGSFATPPAWPAIVPLPKAYRIEPGFFAFVSVELRPGERYTLEYDVRVLTKLLRVLFDRDSRTLDVVSLLVGRYYIVGGDDAPVTSRTIDGWDFTLRDLDVPTLQPGHIIAIELVNPTDKPVLARISGRTLVTDR